MSKQQAGQGMTISGMIGMIVATALTYSGYGTAAGIVMMAALAQSVAGGIISKPGKITPKAAGKNMNASTSRLPLPLLYGEVVAGCNKTFYHAANKYFHMVCELGEGPIDGIVRQDGSIWTQTGTELPLDNPPLIYLDNKIWTEYVWYGIYANGRTDYDEVHYPYLEFFNGQADQDICASLASAPNSKWDQTLRRTAWIYLRLESGVNSIAAEPDLTAKVRGLKVHNPITDVTEWTNNPALHAYDYITRSSQRGGIGIDPSRIDLSALDAAIDYCETKGWTCNLPIDEQQAVADNLAQILSCFRGDVIRSENKFKIKFRDLNYEPIVMDLTEADIVTSGGRSSLVIRQPDVTHRPNAIRATWLAAMRNSKPDDYVFPDSAAVAADGDVREKAVDLYGLDNLPHVQKMCNYLLERERLNRESGATTRERAAALEPLDLIRLTHSMPGWDQQVLRVLSVGIAGNHTVTLQFIEEDETFYDDVYNLTDQDYHDTTLIDPNADPPDVINASLAEEVYFYRGRSFTRLLINFEPPADYPWFDHAECWISTDGENFRHQFDPKANCSIDPVNEGQRYWVRLRTVNIYGRRQEESTAVLLSKMINGKTTAPSNLAGLSAIPSGDTVILAANPVSDPDIVGYEVRIGDSWAGGVFLAFNLDSRMTLSNVKPGTHTFWMAAKDNAGHYSDTPVSATVTVFMPAGFTLANSWSWDFDGIGTHSNTEHAVYSAQDALKCSHTSDVLTGTWTSPEYDLGSIKTVRTFGDFKTAFVDPAGSFASIWGTDRSFADVDPAAGKNFSELYSLLAAGVLRAQLRWGDSSGSLNNSLDWFEISAAEISGRYVQVVVTIVDPALDANLYLYELQMKAYTF